LIIEGWREHGKGPVTSRADHTIGGDRNEPAV